LNKQSDTAISPPSETAVAIWAPLSAIDICHSSHCSSVVANCKKVWTDSTSECNGADPVQILLLSHKLEA
jgi:hypothetical protein